MKRLIRIGSRKSDLARLQAKLVGQALTERGYGVEYVFREAPADVNLSNPLWQMPTVGVFTSFLHEYLLKGEVDVVVHSWKDLPIDKNPGTSVVATLTREDPRDLFLFKKDQHDSHSELIVLTSSPRRKHNLADFLGRIIPFHSKLSPDRNAPRNVRFLDVRGNIQTRMAKLCDPERLQLDPDTNRSADGLIVAKAAVDRFLSTVDPEFASTRDAVRKTLEQCHWAVLPLSVNPTAAAQGALALEVSDAKPEIKEIIEGLNCEKTFSACEEERRILKSLGGGCHQKIGCTVLPRHFGNVYSLRGESDKGQDINWFGIGRVQEHDDRKGGQMIPDTHRAVGGRHGLSVFEREEISLDRLALSKNTSRNILITKSDALPKDALPALFPGSTIWTAGIDSWLKLVQRNIWVNGCSDRLGEGEDPMIDALVGGDRMTWLKLTHEDAPGTDKIATYRLKPIQGAVEKLRDHLSSSTVDSRVTHIFWASSSCFEFAFRSVPELLLDPGIIHGCGPGHTFDAVSKKIDMDRIVVCLGVEEFVRKTSA